MNNLILVGLPLLAGLAIGCGIGVILCNKRIIGLDPWTKRFGLNPDDLSKGDNGTPIHIVDNSFDPPTKFAQVTMLGQQQHERVTVARLVADSLNHYKERE